MEKEMLEYKKEIEQLKSLLQKSMKIHPKTLQKINRNLTNNSHNTLTNSNNTITNNTLTNNSLTNNTLTNNTLTNNYYVQLGNEDLINVLTKSQKRAILNRKGMGINDLVELIHCSGKYKEFMNVYITNLQNTIAYRYDKKINNFIAVNKTELLDEIIDCRIYDIQKFFDEAQHLLDPNHSADIIRILKRMDDTDDCLKGLKKDEIKLILYNNKEKIATQKDKFRVDNDGNKEIIL